LFRTLLSQAEKLCYEEKEHIDFRPEQLPLRKY